MNHARVLLTTVPGATAAHVWVYPAELESVDVLPPECHRWSTMAPERDLVVAAATRAALRLLHA